MTTLAISLGALVALIPILAASNNASVGSTEESSAMPKASTSYHSETTLSDGKDDSAINQGASSTASLVGAEVFTPAVEGVNADVGAKENRDHGNLKIGKATLTPSSELEGFLLDAWAEADPDNTMHLPSASLVLIDLNKNEYAVHKPNELRYPASLSKLFWAIALLRVYEQSELEIDESIQSLIFESIHESDNNAAAEILDLIVSINDIAASLDCDRRQDVISTTIGRLGVLPQTSLIRSNYPLSDSPDPKGCDLGYPKNQVSAWDVAQLLYRLNHCLPSLDLSNDSCNLVIDAMLQNQFEENQEEYGMTKGFMGQHVPETTTIFTKVGFTLSQGRSEAIIMNVHGEGAFLAVVMGDGKRFSDYEEFLPQYGATIHNLMKSRFQAQ
jgi:hypothetical protein